MNNYIEKLLNGREVEWKTLGEVVRVKKGKQLNKTELKEIGDYPAYNGGINYSGFTDKYNVNENTIIISQGGASAGYVQFINCKFWANAHCFYIEPNLEIITNKYVYYFIKNKQKFLMECKFGAGIPGLRVSDIENIEIPIPPRDVQEEIVRVLDLYTELTKELTKELTLRGKQYEYFRDKLLNFSNLESGGGV